MSTGIGRLPSVRSDDALRALRRRSHTDQLHPAE